MGVRARFERDGFAVVRSGLDRATVAEAAGHLDALRSRLRLPRDAAIVAAAGDDQLDRLARDERLAGLAADLLGGDVASFGATYLCKPPKIGLPARWHQDGEPWAKRLGGAAALTVWVALSKADEASGCLLVVPGSHHLPAQPLRADEDEPSLFGAGMDPSLVEEHRAIALPVLPGDLVLHHPNLVHASGPNRTEAPRVALAIRYRALP